MKKLRLFILAPLALLLLAASAPIVTDSLVRIQTDPGASTTVTAFFQKTTVIDSDTFQGAMEPVTWQSNSTRSITFTFNGSSVTMPYAEASAAIVAIANQERTDPTPPAH